MNNQEKLIELDLFVHNEMPEVAQEWDALLIENGIDVDDEFGILNEHIALADNFILGKKNRPRAVLPTDNPQDLGGMSESKNFVPEEIMWDDMTNVKAKKQWIEESGVTWNDSYASTKWNDLESNIKDRLIIPDLNESKQDVTTVAKEIYGSLGLAQKAYNEDKQSFYAEISAQLPSQEDVSLIDNIFNRAGNMSESFEVEPKIFAKMEKYAEKFKDINKMIVRVFVDRFAMIIDEATIQYVTGIEGEVAFGLPYVNYLSELFDSHPELFLLDDGDNRALILDVFGSEANYKEAILCIALLCANQLEENTLLSYTDLGTKLAYLIFPIEREVKDLSERSLKTSSKLYSCNESVINHFLKNNHHYSLNESGDSLHLVNRVTSSIDAKFSKDKRACSYNHGAFDRYGLNEARTLLALRNRVRSLNEDGFGVSRETDEINTDPTLTAFDVKPEFLEWLMDNGYCSESIMEFSHDLTDIGNLGYNDLLLLDNLLSSNGHNPEDLLVAFTNRANESISIGGIQCSINESLETGERTMEVLPVNELEQKKIDMIGGSEFDVIVSETLGLTKNSNNTYIFNNPSGVTSGMIADEFGILGDSNVEIIDVLNDKYSDELVKALNEDSEANPRAFPESFTILRGDLENISTNKNVKLEVGQMFIYGGRTFNSGIWSGEYYGYAYGEQIKISASINRLQDWERAGFVNVSKDLSESKLVHTKKEALVFLMESKKLSGAEDLWKLHEGVDAPITTYADMIVYNTDGKLLLLQRNSECDFEPNKWGFAGGKVQVGEITQVGAIRECKEEAGVTVNEVDKVGEFTNPDGSVSHYYKGVTSDEVILSEESQNFIWIDPTDVVNYDLILNNCARFDLVVNGKTTSLNEASLTDILSSLGKGDVGEIASLIASPKKYAKASLGRIILDKLNKKGIVGDKATGVIDGLLKFYPVISTGIGFFDSLLEAEIAKNVEYVIWGIAPNTSEEQLLLGRFEGKPIKDKQMVDNLLKVLSNKGCTELRIQEVNLGDNSFGFGSSLNEAENEYTKEIKRIEEQMKVLKTQDKSVKRDEELADLKKQVEELKGKDEQDKLDKLQIRIDALEKEIQIEKNQERLDKLKADLAQLEARKQKYEQRIKDIKDGINKTVNTADDLMTDPDINMLFKNK